MKNLMISCVMELIILIYLHNFIPLIVHQHGFVSTTFLYLFDYLYLFYSAEQATANNPQIKPGENRFLHHLRPSTAGSQISRDHYASHQQMDAENRLQHLEVIRPKENINLLNAKFRTLQHPRHARPILPQYRDDYVKTFYDQTGRYVQERAGLYHTENYEPSALVKAIPELDNQEGNYSTIPNENTLHDSSNKTKPKLFQYRALGDYQNMRVS